MSSVSNVFVVCVLSRVLDSARCQVEEGGFYSFPQKDSDVLTSLRAAALDAHLYCDKWECESLYGGATPFNINDPTTYWTSPSQLELFYSENVSRRKRLAQLQVRVCVCMYVSLPVFCMFACSLPHSLLLPLPSHLPCRLKLTQTEAALLSTPTQSCRLLRTSRP